MDKGKILVLAIVLLIIIGLIFSIFKSKKQEIDYSEDAVVQTEKVAEVIEENKTSIETNFSQALSEVRELYKYYDSENFDIYFNMDFINEYMEGGSLKIVNDINLINKDEKIYIYDLEGNKLEEFPTTFSDGKEIQYEEEIYNIQPNKNYLLKMNSYSNSYCYYYILKYDKNGYADIKEICYTKGETVDIYGGE